MVTQAEAPLGTLPELAVFAELVRRGLIPDVDFFPEPSFRGPATEGWARC